MFTYSIEMQGDLSMMVNAGLDFINSIPNRVAPLIMDDFIDIAAPASGQRSADHVAALILAGRDEEAAAICRDALAVKEWGGPARTTADGKIVTFFDFALRWIGERDGNK